MSLAEAMVSGTGIERPFLCPDHPDTRPSASVNVAKMVWYCYTCGSHGEADENHEQALDALLKLAHMEHFYPEPYPESWLNLYDAGGAHEYWLSRFSAEAVRHFRLGYDPEKDAVTYPLRDAAGRVLGVVRRRLGDPGGAKYKYPYRINIGNYLFNYVPDKLDHVVLVEGATDAIAAWEAGFTAFAIYGSRMSARQLQLIDRCDPELVLCAFDQDHAGREASQQVTAEMGHRQVARVRWDPDEGKDLADLSVQRRHAVLTSSLDIESQFIIGSGVCASSTPRNRLRVICEQPQSVRLSKHANKPRRLSEPSTRLKII